MYAGDCRLASRTTWPPGILSARARVAGSGGWSPSAVTGSVCRPSQENWHLRKSLGHEHRLVPLEHPDLMCRTRGTLPIEVAEGQTVDVVNAKAARDVS